MVYSLQRCASDGFTSTPIGYSASQSQPRSRWPLHYFLASPALSRLPSDSSKTEQDTNTSLPAVASYPRTRFSFHHRLQPGSPGTVSAAFLLAGKKGILDTHFLGRIRRKHQICFLRVVCRHPRVVSLLELVADRPKESASA